MGNRAEGSEPAPRRVNPIVSHNFAVELLEESRNIRNDTAENYRANTAIRESLSMAHTRLDGIILDGDVRGQKLGLVQSDLSSLTLWGWIRDTIIIILLAVTIGVLVWRGLRVETLLGQCVVG